MTLEEPSSKPEDVVSQWENYFQRESTISRSGQEQLRSLLRLQNESDTGLRNRILELLNPHSAEVEVVELSDEELNSRYSIITRDNYAPLPCRGHTLASLRFDVTHGYYVLMEIEPLD